MLAGRRPAPHYKCGAGDARSAMQKRGPAQWGPFCPSENILRLQQCRAGGGPRRGRRGLGGEERVSWRMPEQRPRHATQRRRPADARRSDLHLRLELCIPLRLLLLLDGDRRREIDGALDDGILVDDEARRDDVAGDLRGVAQLDALGGVNLPFHPAADNDSRALCATAHSLLRPRSGGSRSSGFCR